MGPSLFVSRIPSHLHSTPNYNTMDPRQSEEARRSHDARRAMEATHRRLRYELTVDRHERQANRILRDMREEKRREGVERLRSERRNRDLRNGHEAGSFSNPSLVAPPEVRHPRTERPPRPTLEDGRWPHGRRPLVELLTEV